MSRIWSNAEIIAWFFGVLENSDCCLSCGHLYPKGTGVSGACSAKCEIDLRYQRCEISPEERITELRRLLQ